MLRIAVSLKAVVLVGLVVALPLLALPVAARLIDARLSGSPPADLTAAPLADSEAEAVTLPMIVERVSPADLAGPASPELPTGGLDAAAPPPVAPPAAFDPDWAQTVPPAADEEVPIDDETIGQLQQIRQRLEQLGADYVIVETTDYGGRFRFHCRMVVDANSRFTRPFEAISPNPLAAGEQVLREVEAWRLAASDPARLR